MKNETTKKVSYDSSVPAISKIFHSETKLRKFFYFTVFLLSTGICSFHLLQFIDAYFKYPVLNFANVESNLINEFPAVTICNLNRVKKELELVPILKSENEFLSEIQPRTRLVLTARKLFLNFANLGNDAAKKYLREAQSYFNCYVKSHEMTRYLLGYKLTDIIEKCSFNSRPCYQNNFTLFQSLQYGNCYTFNMRKTENGPRLKTDRIGSDSGLELTLNIGAVHYDYVTPSIGMRVIVHDPNEDPDPMENGVNISPGFDTHIAVTKSSIQRLPSPYKDKCLDYKNNDEKSGFSSQVECIKKCTQDVSFSKCFCVDPFLNAGINVRRCDLTNATEMLCLDEVLEDMSKHGLPCNCPIACLATDYSLEISSSTWSSYYEHDSTNFRYLFPGSVDSNASNEYPGFLDYLNPNKVLNEHNSSFDYSYLDTENIDYDNISIFLTKRSDDFYPDSGEGDLYDITFKDCMEEAQLDSAMTISNISGWNFSEVNNLGISEDIDDTIPKVKKAKLKVFFKTFDHTVYFQTPMLTGNEIVSHIGGLLSLWLGLSIFEFFEVFDMLFLFFKRFGS